MEGKRRKFANDDALVLNPEKSVTLIPDSYVDKLNSVKLI